MEVLWRNEGNHHEEINACNCESIGQKALKIVIQMLYTGKIPDNYYEYSYTTTCKKNRQSNNMMCNNINDNNMNSNGDINRVYAQTYVLR